MNRRARKTFFSVTVVFLVLTVPASAAWVITEIPNLPTWVGNTQATDINSSGVVCGMGNYVINTSSTAYRYDGFAVTELPHLVPADPITLVWGINADGVICGYSHNANGDSRACYWEGTTLHTVPYPDDADTNDDFRAYDINDDGVIVGYYTSTNGERNVFYYKDGASHSLGPAIRAAGLPGGQGVGQVNNRNVICGNAADVDGRSSVYVYDIDTGGVTLLGRIGTYTNSATHINAPGQVIGRAKYHVDDLYWRVATHAGSWQFVGPEPPHSQWPQGINDNGRVIGKTYVASSVRRSWFSDGPDYDTVTVIALPGWPTVNVAGITNDDWIVGYGDPPAAGNDLRAFILKPPPGDKDHDGDVDLYDFCSFQLCCATTGPLGAGCAAFDFDTNGAVDLDDFNVLEASLDGPTGGS